MKAQNLLDEYTTKWDQYSKPQRAALKARVTRLSGNTQDGSMEASILTGLAEALGMKISFPLYRKEIIPQVFRLQLIRDGAPAKDRQKVTSPLSAAAMIAPYLEAQDREHLVVLMLDTKNTVIGMNVVSVGSINSAIISAREVFKAALLTNASAIILGHNHPSGDPTPSPEDVTATKTMMEAGMILDIKVLDHVIIGDDGNSKSLKEMGLI